VRPIGKDPLISAAPVSRTLCPALRRIEVFQSCRDSDVAATQVLPAKQLRISYKIQSFPLLWKAAIQNSPASRKSAGFSGFCGMDLARNAEISQRLMLSGQEDSETKQGDPSSQKSSPHFKFQI
jgi:hypothetical protein